MAICCLLAWPGRSIDEVRMIAYYIDCVLYGFADERMEVIPGYGRRLTLNSYMEATLVLERVFVAITESAELEIWTCAWKAILPDLVKRMNDQDIPLKTSWLDHPEMVFGILLRRRLFLLRW
eukprot:TRINITY_DN12049_c0_g1_i5.p2 TRINITY_DN12049_c0_g1~~TRINITY_DN12049_c0_g1_i5.p2  ORF type:complete len:122 (+),score=7.78 TRINITY_DN12049_c0_g1_i5:107-472(+)